MINGRYDDIIDLPHPEPKKHPRMSMQARAAQFAPFAALTGYAAEIKETERLTQSFLEMEDDDKLLINKKLQLISLHIKETPYVEITFFRPDAKKEGGEYITVSGNAKKIDTFTKLVHLTDGTRIPIEMIFEISGEVCETPEEW